MGGQDDFDWAEFRRLTAERRPRARVKYDPEHQRTTKPRWTRPRFDDVRAIEIKSSIKQAVILNPAITTSELAEQFEGVSPITLSAIRTQFLADLRFLYERGNLVGVALPKRRRARCA